MHTKTQNTVVVMPDNSHLEVSYYCMDKKLGGAEKKHSTRLYIQLSDCISSFTITKDICAQPHELEKMVHNRVINAKGHLCE